LTRKTKGRKPEGLRQFLLYILSISTSEGQLSHFPNFICPTKPTAYAKKEMLRVLTSFRLNGETARLPGLTPELVTKNEQNAPLR
jgi:hypothetical protein